jgi:hypothetical protein
VMRQGAPGNFHRSNLTNCSALSLASYAASWNKSGRG